MGKNLIQASMVISSLQSSQIKKEQSDQVSVLPVALYVIFIIAPTTTFNSYIIEICLCAYTPIPTCL